MKFCYLDESGTGSEPYAVMVAVVVDGSRMQVTKKDWDALLRVLSKKTGKQVREFHTKDFYAGNGIWRGVGGDDRSIIIGAILSWLQERKHKISFSGINKKKYLDNCQNDRKLKDIGSLWCALGFHQVLAIQKAHQSNGAKGYSVLIFDEKLEEKNRIARLVKSPPEWTSTYYSKKLNDHPLNKIVDVPYFGDSERVNLLQVADLLAYIIRRYLEINEAGLPEKYPGETKMVQEWVKRICKLALPTSTRYLKKDRCECSSLFYDYAPESITTL